MKKKNIYFVCLFVCTNIKKEEEDVEQKKMLLDKSRKRKKNKFT
jgi:hypothetical protein